MTKPLKKKEGKNGISERQKRFDAFVKEMVIFGGFTEKQASYLINMLNEFFPIV